jgi:hypothetical protein
MYNGSMPKESKRSADVVSVTYPDLGIDSQDSRPGPSSYPPSQAESLVPEHLKAMLRARLAAKEKISK